VLPLQEEGSKEIIYKTEKANPKEKREGQQKEAPDA